MDQWHRVQIFVPFLACALLIPELDTRGEAKQTDGGSVAVHKCGTLFLDLRYSMWLCLTVMCGTALSLLTLASEEAGLGFFLLESLFSILQVRSVCWSAEEP